MHFSSKFLACLALPLAVAAPYRPGPAIALVSLQAGNPAAADKLPDNLPLNHVQVIGSHNSYKQAIDAPLLRQLKKADSTSFRSLEYSHRTLSEQLSLGLRGLEIDIYADSKGGKYAHPKGLEWEGPNAQVAPYDPQGVMNESGFKVFHVQDIDFRSNCLTLKQGLQELKKWSEAHPGHLPVFVTMNAKDDEIKKPGFTVPEKFTAATFDELDKVILETLGAQRLIRPDDVRGKYATLEQAVLSAPWPALKATRGKFVFVLDEVGDKRAAYIQGHPALKGRTLFANAPAGTPEAAILIMNNPVQDSTAIRNLVSKGYFVRTRADADTKQARTNDKSMFNAACRSGAQLVTTDYYEKSTFFKSDYTVSFERGGYTRINPLNKIITPKKM